MVHLCWRFFGTRQTLFAACKCGYNGQNPESMRYFRAGGFNQLVIETAADLRLIPDLEASLWVATSCPTRGLEIDAKTLDCIDRDGDGRVRLPELRAAIRWLLTVLSDYDSVVLGSDCIELRQLDATHPEGARLHAAARRVLGNTGADADDRICLAQVEDRSRIYAAVESNGDGVVPPEASDDAELTAVIREIMAVVGGTRDRSGLMGVTASGVADFFKVLDEYARWYREARPEGGAVNADVLPLGDRTAAALAVFETVESLAEEFFRKCRVVGFDPRTAGFMNFSAATLAGLEHQSADERDALLRRMPVSHIGAGEALRLRGAVNPAYAANFEAFADKVVEPLFGEPLDNLSEAQWRAISARLQPYRKWRGRAPSPSPAALGIERIETVLRGNARGEIEKMIRHDQRYAAEMDALDDLERLLRYHRDLFELANNFVAMPRLYNNDNSEQAIFQAGRLVIDGLTLQLCVEVADRAKHSVLAAHSGIFLVYVELRRSDFPQPRVVVGAVTCRNAGRLMVGKNGVFFDRKGRDWDATVVQIISNPISLTEAAWAPFQRIGELVSGQLERLTQSRQKSIEASITQSVTEVDQQLERVPGSIGSTPGSGDRPVAPAAAPATNNTGTLLAGGGLALAALGSSFAFITNTIQKVDNILFLYTALAIIAIILVPSVLLAWIRLFHRDLGMVLEASGWAINGKMRITRGLSRSLSRVGKFPSSASRSPGPDSTAVAMVRSRRVRLLVLIMLILAAILLTGIF